MSKIGAHVSAAVSLERAFDKAQEIGADCVQLFISPPQQWFQSKHRTEEIERFRVKQADTGIGPNFIHGTYLVNLGTQTPEHLEKSIDWLIYAMNLASKMGVRGLIFHLGSHKGVGFEKVLGQIVESLKKVLERTKGLEGPESNSAKANGPEDTPHPIRSEPHGRRPNPLPEGEGNNSRGTRSPREAGGTLDTRDTLLLLETSAGAGGGLGGTFKELGEILKRVSDDRLKICLDTQHVFAAGYDLKTPLGLKDVLEEFDQEIGLSNLAAIHANDSKTEYKSGRDRHENIGEGFIGREGFEGLVNHPALQEVPFILEVPGFAGNGPDKENVEMLKSLVK